MAFFNKRDDKEQQGQRRRWWRVDDWLETTVEAVVMFLLIVLATVVAISNVDSTLKREHSRSKALRASELAEEINNRKYEAQKRDETVSYALNELAGGYGDDVSEHYYAALVDDHFIVKITTPSAGAKRQLMLPVDAVSIRYRDVKEPRLEYHLHKYQRQERYRICLPSKAEVTVLQHNYPKSDEEIEHAGLGYMYLMSDYAAYGIGRNTYATYYSGRWIVTPLQKNQNDPYKPKSLPVERTHVHFSSAEDPYAYWTPHVEWDKTVPKTERIYHLYMPASIVGFVFDED